MPRQTASIRLPALVSSIERQIYSIRGHRVMLDIDLAEFYGVPTKRLNEQVKRNLKRFPKDFMFRLTRRQTQTVLSLRSQFASLKRGRHRKYAAQVFSEQGVAMLSSVLNSERSIAVNIAIMRAFVKTREVSATHKDLARQIRDMESKYDANFREVFETIYRLVEPASEPAPPRHRMGFMADTRKRL